MASAISSVPSPALLDVLPSRTSSSGFADPTVFSNSPLLRPRINQIDGCCANKVIINLSTALVIPNYNLYYSGPIDSFQPSFYALDDGSLIAPPFIDDLSNANLSLLVNGMLTMLFVRNIIVSGDYLRRVKVKKKTLFYVLFLSQILAPVSLVPVIMSSFSQAIDCTAVVVLSCVTGTGSLALLITGIFGVKAYKCLNNSRMVLIFLVIFQLATSVIVVLDIIATHGERRLSGSCVRVSELVYTRIFVWIQVVESLFICCCFMYACWKSRGSAAARGRISIQLSMEDIPIEVPEDTAERRPNLRGWWDYIPDKVTSPTTREPASKRKSFHKARSKLSKVFGRAQNKRQAPSNQYPREKSENTRTQARQSGAATPIPRVISPAPTTGSRFGKLVPSIHLFQKVVKDELLYTTFITATCVVIAVLTAIGLNFKNGLTVTGWIALNWSIISLLALHSFGRVVCRHERDALLQHSFTYSALARVGNVAGEKKPREHQTSSFSPPRYGQGADDENDPFSDSRRLELSRSSWGSNFPPSIERNPRNPFDDDAQIDTSIPNPFGDTASTSSSSSQRSSQASAAQGYSRSEAWLLGRGSISTSGDEGREEKIHI